MLAIETILTDDAGGRILARWDGERFAIVQQNSIPDDATTKTIILNPIEMLELVKFAGSCGGVQC